MPSPSPSSVGRNVSVKQLVCQIPQDQLCKLLFEQVYQDILEHEFENFAFSIPLANKHSTFPQAQHGGTFDAYLRTAKRTFIKIVNVSAFISTALLGSMVLFEVNERSNNAAVRAEHNARIAERARIHQQMPRSGTEAPYMITNVRGPRLRHLNTNTMFNDTCPSLLGCSRPFQAARDLRHHCQYVEYKSDKYSPQCQAMMYASDMKDAFDFFVGPARAAVQLREGIMPASTALLNSYKALFNIRSLDGLMRKVVADHDLSLSRFSWFNNKMNKVADAVSMTGARTLLTGMGILIHQSVYGTLFRSLYRKIFASPFAPQDVRRLTQAQLKAIGEQAVMMRSELVSVAQAMSALKGNVQQIQQAQLSIMPRYTALMALMTPQRGDDLVRQACIAILAEGKSLPTNTRMLMIEASKQPAEKKRVLSPSPSASPASPSPRAATRRTVKRKAANTQVKQEALPVSRETRRRRVVTPTASTAPVRRSTRLASSQKKR
jgi:hypothetical protein